MCSTVPYVRYAQMVLWKIVAEMSPVLIAELHDVGTGGGRRARQAALDAEQLLERLHHQLDRGLVELSDTDEVAHTTEELRLTLLRLRRPRRSRIDAGVLGSLRTTLINISCIKEGRHADYTEIAAVSVMQLAAKLDAARPGAANPVVDSIQNMLAEMQDSPPDATGFSVHHLERVVEILTPKIQAERETELISATAMRLLLPVLRADEADVVSGGVLDALRQLCDQCRTPGRVGVTHEASARSLLLMRELVRQHQTQGRTAVSPLFETLTRVRRCVVGQVRPLPETGMALESLVELARFLRDQGWTDDPLCALIASRKPWDLDAERLTALLTSADRLRYEHRDAIMDGSSRSRRDGGGGARSLA